jgi:hypothetical protein
MDSKISFWICTLVKLLFISFVIVKKDDPTLVKSVIPFFDLNASISDSINFKSVFISWILPFIKLMVFTAFWFLF